MTRTNRNLPVNRYPLRNFRNHSEKSQLDQILNDPELKELPVSKLNRIKSRRCEKGKLPDTYEDILISAYRETEWRHHD